MAGYLHHVSGFFEHQEQAVSTCDLLRQRGFEGAQLQIYAADQHAPPAPDPQQQSNTVLKDMLVDGAIGGAVGTGLGGLVTVALIATNVSIFVASPLLAPLMLLGWGASLGAVAGAVVGASDMAVESKGRFADLIHDAITQGHVVLVVQTHTEAETVIAREVISAAVGLYKDTNMLVSAKHPQTDTVLLV